MAKKKNNKVNSYLLLVILGASIVITLLFGFNIVSVALKKGGGSGSTVEVDSGSSMKNDLYTIGNNPTNVNKEAFKELTAALKENDPEKISAAVVKCFISEYFTWTNKDGNYEVGGVQYVLSEKYVAFTEQSRWEFYKDLDLYISQFGRENLLEVDNIEIASVTKIKDDYEFWDKTYPQYYVEASWTYKPSSKINVNEFQTKGYFIVADRDGRYEIAEFYGPY